MADHPPPRAADRTIVAGDVLSISEHRQVHVDAALTGERGDARPSLTIVRQGAHLHHPAGDAGGEGVIVDAGSAVLYRAHEPFRLSHPFLREAPDVSLYIDFDASLLDEVFGATPGPREQGRPLPPAVQAAAAMVAARGGDDGALAGEERGLRLMSEVARAIDAGGVDPEPTAEARRRIAIVREAIAAAPETHRRLGDLATLAGCSPFHLTRLFRRVTGLTLGQFRLRLRLARALQLIADGGDDLTAVAHAAGFFDHAHMTNSLRRVFGTTPSELRDTIGAARLADAGKVLQAGALTSS